MNRWHADGKPRDSDIAIVSDSGDLPRIRQPAGWWCELLLTAAAFFGNWTSRSIGSFWGALRMRFRLTGMKMGALVVRLRLRSPGGRLSGLQYLYILFTFR